MRGKREIRFILIGVIGGMCMLLYGCQVKQAGTEQTTAVEDSFSTFQGGVAEFSHWINMAGCWVLISLN